MRTFEVEVDSLEVYAGYDGSGSCGDDVAIFRLPDILQEESGSAESKLLIPLADFTADDFLYTGNEISEILGFPTQPHDMAFDLCKMLYSFIKRKIAAIVE